MNGVIQWSDNLSVGIEEIDRQHRVLIDVLNQLFTAVSHNKSEEVIGEALDTLIEYTYTHFELEENLMAGAGYNEAEFSAHKAAHNAFINRVDGIARKSVIENRMVAFELINFLKHWLREHIQVADKKYAVALSKAGFSTRRWEQEARTASFGKKEAWWKFWA